MIKTCPNFTEMTFWAFKGFHTEVDIILGASRVSIF